MKKQLIVLAIAIALLWGGSNLPQPDLPGGTAPVPGHPGKCAYWGVYGVSNGAVKDCPMPNH